MLDYNLYYHSDGPARIYWDAGYRLLSALQGTYRQDIYGQEGNPRFVSPSDFHLQSASPAINAGIDLGINELDAQGLSICGNPDMGAYEFQSELKPLVAPTGPTGLTVIPGSLTGQEGV